MEGADRIAQLDVRPHLRKKLEPFQLIMNAVNRLQKDQIFVLHATIKPTPLLGLLKMKGYRNRVQSVAPDHWIVGFLHKSQGKARLEELDLLRFANVEEGTVDEGATEEGASTHPAALHELPLGDAEHGRLIELDNRGLEPPQPMVRTLKALEQCEPGDRVLIHNDRVPMFLIEELQKLGFGYRIEMQPDGSAKLMITKTDK
ncbi:DUF2249 domain-containing protein [Paenibacillus xanthanilyticus]|uniref:DUF2249 domain-containing protein n=1 Tax=Paenibacillus xanthanilyticus TaxID=1783531 RepID=A0ABV8K989_9BACL